MSSMGCFEYDVAFDMVNILFQIQLIFNGNDTFDNPIYDIWYGIINCIIVLNPIERLKLEAMHFSKRN